MVALTKENATHVLGTPGSCVVLYHMQGCPHCVMMRPSWDTAVRSAGKGVRVIEVEYGNMALLPRSLQNVRGFPTIMAIRDQKPYAEYTGDRSTESLRDFLVRHAPPGAPPAAAKKARPAATAAPKKKKATAPQKKE